MNQVSFSNSDEIGTPNKPLDSYKKGGEIKHISGSAGGYLVGNRHSDGGIKAINKSTGQPLEMEGGEVVITRNAVSDQTKYEFEGEMLTNREILSKINEGGGGVAFADGGEVCHVCDAEYNYKGKKMKDSEIFREMALGGEVNDILEAVDNLDFNEEVSEDLERQKMVDLFENYPELKEILKYCFAGKNEYSGKYYHITQNTGNYLALKEVFSKNPDYIDAISIDKFIENFTIMAKPFSLYVNYTDTLFYKEIGTFKTFTLGDSNNVALELSGEDKYVDSDGVILVTNDNIDLLRTKNYTTLPKDISDIVSYQKTLLNDKFTALERFETKFEDKQFFKVYAIIHRDSINEVVDLIYAMQWYYLDSKTFLIFNISETGKFYNIKESYGFGDYYDDNLTKISFSNDYNLDIVIGYYNAFKNINLGVLLKQRIPFSMLIEEKSEEVVANITGFNYLDDNLSFEYKTDSDPRENIIFNTFENISIDSIELNFKSPSYEVDMKYLESRIKELGQRINLFRASMSLEEYGAVQRKLRTYNEMLQSRYLQEQNSNLNNFFDRMKSALKLEFGDIDKKYEYTDKLSVNGLRSQLTEQEWFKVRTEDFKIWFGDWEKAYYDQNYSGVSVIIDDATKEPLPVYHGTNVKFVDWKTYESNNLHYFAKKREMSEWFARAWQMGRDDKAGKESEQIKQGNPFQGAYLYRVFLDIKNPVDFSPFGVDKVKLVDLIAFLKIRYGVGDYELWTNNEYFKKGAVTMESKIYTWQIIRLWQSFNTYIREFTPYDGFIFYEYIPSKANSGNIEDASLSYCAFRTDQIKFHDAVSFSPEINDSRFALGGEVITKKTRRKTK